MEAFFNAAGELLIAEEGNVEGVLLPLVARTVATDSADQVNAKARGVRVRVNVTAAAVGASVTVGIQEKESVSGNYVDILRSAAITAVGEVPTLVVYPGCAAVASQVADQPLPRTWRVDVAVGNADSVTYSVDYAYVV